MPYQPEAVVRVRSSLRASLLIGLCCLLIYNANWRSISAGDTYPARYLPFAIWQHHTLFLDPVVSVAAQGRGDAAFWMVRLPDRHLISLYPIVVPVLLAPLYLPAAGYLNLRGWTDARMDRVARIMEKFSASLIAALSASLLYLLLRRRATARVALLLTVAYALGTTTWMISSQALWQHGLAQLLVIGALLFLTGPCTAPRALAAGLLLGLVAVNRPPDTILAAALGVYAFVWAGWRRAALLAAAAALPVGLVLFYNLGVAGNLAGGYGLRGTPAFFQHDLLLGIGGLLVSPTRGLFVFSPFLLFLVFAWRHLRGLTLAMGVAVLLQLLLYAKADWRGGVCFGPRYMTDLLPLLLWMLVPVVSTLRGMLRGCFFAAVGVAIAIEAIGAFFYTGATDWKIFAEDGMRGAWNWRNAPFLASLRHGLAPMELTLKVQGGLDNLAPVAAGQEAVATGWALAGHATPWRVAIVIDGRQTIDSRTFYPRPELRAALHEANVAAWSIPFDTAGLTPGEHAISALVWASEKGEPRYLAERKLTVAAPPVADAQPLDLAISFKQAAARIREHQQPDGFWLTAFTGGIRFRDPHPEMNTYLTSLLIDLLQPIAAQSGLEENVQRARRHLTSQIEPGGLVRYHGKGGCGITPDTDDTALVWRIAPGPDLTQRASALATIARYRTDEGLYRTWLAPREAYRCLDPGSDPNPADLVIQMHLLLLLSEAQPPAAHALCEALQPVVDDDRVWAYYRNVPLVPILRIADLRRAGCELQLPESRMRTGVPGQRIWVSAVRPSSPDEARAVLNELARKDFALLRSSPPLLYHNDLTAAVPRFYWSEDVGYALWLRLYEQHYGNGHPAPSN
ncbi:MAG TPA: hypothetical protein VKB93_10165 [Thermoanaerobaculia bacterium]|nr:hypothetical protein [Thermoanaerobaculia bacterium]